MHFKLAFKLISGFLTYLKYTTTSTLEKDFFLHIFGFACSTWNWFKVYNFFPNNFSIKTRILFTSSGFSAELSDIWAFWKIVQLKHFLKFGFTYSSYVELYMEISLSVARTDSVEAPSTKVRFIKNYWTNQSKLFPMPFDRDTFPKSFNRF